MKSIKFREDIQKDIDNGKFPKSMTSISPIKKTMIKPIKKSVSKKSLTDTEELQKPNSEEDGFF